MKRGRDEYGGFNYESECKTLLLQRPLFQAMKKNRLPLGYSNGLPEHPLVGQGTCRLVPNTFFPCLHQWVASEWSALYANYYYYGPTLNLFAWDPTHPSYNLHLLICLGFAYMFSRIFKKKKLGPYPKFVTALFAYTIFVQFQVHATFLAMWLGFPMHVAVGGMILLLEHACIYLKTSFNLLREQRYLQRVSA